MQSSTTRNVQAVEEWRGGEPGANSASNGRLEPGSVHWAHLKASQGMASFVVYPCEGLPAERPVQAVAASASDALGAAAADDGSVHVFDDEVSRTHKPKTGLVE